MARASRLRASADAQTRAGARGRPGASRRRGRRRPDVSRAVATADGNRSESLADADVVTALSRPNCSTRSMSGWATLPVLRPEPRPRFRGGQVSGETRPPQSGARTRARLSRTGAVRGRRPARAQARGAVAGDVVEGGPEAVTVNGQRLPGSSTAASESLVRELPHVAWGRYVVGVDELWLVSTHVPSSRDI
jgi:hypothetical protein